MREGGREGGREGEREGGREGGRDRGSEGVVLSSSIFSSLTTVRHSMFCV